MKKKNHAAAELGRRGGKARAKKLGKKGLSEAGRKAVNARWAKKRQSVSIIDQLEKISAPRKAPNGAAKKRPSGRAPRTQV
jgi:hypothetical protein